MTTDIQQTTKYYQYKTKTQNGSIYRAVFIGNSTLVDHVELLKNKEWVELSPVNWVVLGMKKRSRKILRGEDYLNYANVSEEDVNAK